MPEMRRRATGSLSAVVALTLFGWGGAGQGAQGQAFSKPARVAAVEGAGRTRSSEKTPSATAPSTPVDSSGTTSGDRLPAEAGQVWRDYDIRGYTNRFANHPEPQRAIIDWILRETGTDIWFGETTSLLNGNRERIRVYHTPEVQRQVAEIVERYTRSYPQSHSLAVRLVTVGNPNWRVTAVPMMQPVNVQTPGVQAWLLSRENAAWLLASLRQRTDFREYNSPNLVIFNGQTHTISSRRPNQNAAMTSSWVPTAGVGAQGFTGAAGGSAFGQGLPEEGFSLRIDNLLTKDQQEVDAVIKCDVDQLEGLTMVSLEPRTAAAGLPNQIQIPQMSSWQIHERFRWPVNEVLIVSRGVVATPGRANGQRGGIADLVSAAPPRADALLVLESQAETPSSARRRAEEIRTGSLKYRGRY